jgi:prophage regulatory protein
MDKPRSDEKLIRFRELRQSIPLSRSTIWRKIKNNEFPQPIRIGKVAVAWLWSDIQQWIDNQVAVSRKRN